MYNNYSCQKYVDITARVGDLSYHLPWVDLSGSFHEHVRRMKTYPNQQDTYGWTEPQRLAVLYLLSTLVPLYPQMRDEN